MDAVQRSGDCPDADALQRFVRGLVPEEEAAPLEDHLGWCPRCLETLRALNRTDTLAGKLHGAEAAAERLAPDTDVQDLMRRLRQLRVELPAEPSSVRGQSGASAAGAVDFLRPAEGPGELGRLGPYRVVGVLGSGGMGVVFRAEHLRLERPVALKVLRPALAASTAACQRFRREARAAAGISHDHVITIFEEGEDRGLPFLAMPLLAGETLEERVRREGRLGVSEVIRIGREIAAGLAAAHERGLVHRDVKPGNVWLEARGDERPACPPGPRSTSEPPAATGGRVKLLDFGLVRALDGEGHLTEPGMVAGTPHYMAPEQAAGEEVDARSDLFSLGCVLYRLATGELPFPGTSSRAVLHALATAAPRPPREINPGLPPALAGLVLRLLEKDRGRRPASAQEVIAALAAIEQAPDSPCLIPRGRRTSRALLLTAMVVGLAVYGLSQFLRPDRDPNAPDPGPTVTLPAAQLPVDALRRADIPAHELRSAGGGDAARAPAELVAVLGDSRLRTGDRISRLALSPDGKTVASVSDDRMLKLWDTATGEERFTIPGQAADFFSVAFSEDGTMLAAGGGPVQPTIKVWEAASGKLLTTLPAHEGAIYHVAFSPDGKRLAATLWGSLKVWEMASKRLLYTVPGDIPTFSRDGRTLATIVRGATVKFHDAATGQETGSWERKAYFAFPAFSPDLKTVTAQPRGDGLLDLVDVGTGQVCRQFRHEAPVVAAAFSPDGRLLASADLKSRLKLWDAATGKELPPLRVHPGPIGQLTFNRDGGLLAALGQERVRLWDLASREERFPSERQVGSLSALTFRADGQELVTGAQDGSVRWWDLATRTERITVVGHTGHVVGLAFSPDGRTLASSGYEGVIRLWGSRPHLFRPSRAGPHPDVPLAWSPNGETLVSGSPEGAVRVWNAATGDLRQELPGDQGRTLSVSFSIDGLLGVGALNTTLYRGDPLAAVGTVKGTHAAFSPDGKTLATVGFQVVTLWDPVTRKEITHFPGLPACHGLAWSPDGRWLAELLSDEQSTVMLWPVGDSSLRVTILKVPTTVRGMSFSPESRHLATANGTGTVSLFRLALPPAAELRQP